MLPTRHGNPVGSLPPGTMTSGGGCGVATVCYLRSFLIFAM